MKWKSVVFVDLDDTVMEGPFESVVFPTVFSELALRTGLHVEEVRRRVVAENLVRQTQSCLSATRIMDWDDILRAVAETLGVQLESNVLEIVKAHAGPPFSKLLDHADVVLRQLARPHRAIVAATKGLGKYQYPVLDALGLTPVFTEILTPDSQNALKRDIAFYGKWPKSTIIQVSVGDHYQDDVLAPKSFGFRAIWKVEDRQGQLALLDPVSRAQRYLDDCEQIVRPDAIIVTLEELPEVIAEIEANLL